MRRLINNKWYFDFGRITKPSAAADPQAVERLKSCFYSYFYLSNVLVLIITGLFAINHKYLPKGVSKPLECIERICAFFGITFMRIFFD